MFKVYIVLAALAVAGVSAQVAQPGSEAAPEPYSYGYETDSHSAAEQRDPSGKVSGFYTIADADGRQRRVEYFADESGFHAKVQTNEVGTKSENSADVEIQASPPTEAQYASVQQVQAAPPAAVSGLVRNQQQQVTQVAAAPARSTSAISYNQVQQPAGYGYYGYGSSGYGSSAYPAGQYGGQYGAQYGRYGYASQPGYGYGYQTGYSSAPAVSYGYTSSPAASYGYTTTGSVGNYNNHLPSQYYRSVQSGGVTGAPVSSSGAYVVGNGASNQGVSRYVTSNQAVPASAYQGTGSYRSSYSSSSGSSGSSLPVGSSNYIVLQKREADGNSKQN